MGGQPDASGSGSGAAWQQHGPDGRATRARCTPPSIEAAFYRALSALRPASRTRARSRCTDRSITPIHVFGPDRQIDIDRRFIYHDNGWGPYCDDVDVTEVPGDHDRMVLEPSVRVLAGHLRAALDDAERPVAAGHA